jgi:thioredoxin 1
MEKEITVENFEEVVLKSETPILVDFWATWCGPCMRQGPILEELAQEGYAIGKVNVDEQMALAQQYKVMNIPTMVVFRDGQAAERIVGLTGKDKLKSILDA